MTSEPKLLAAIISAISAYIQLEQPSVMTPEARPESEARLPDNQNPVKA